MADNNSNGLFGGGDDSDSNSQNTTQEPKVKKQPQQNQSDGMIQINTRLRLIEEKVSNLNNKIELLENNYIETSKDQNDEMNALNSDVLDLKREIENIKKKIDMITKELKMTAGEDDLKKIRKYLNMWDLTRFVTEDEVEEMIERKINNVQ